MSQIVADRIEEVLKEISDIIKKLNWPDLPIDLKPPIGDFALVCFPAAKILKLNPSDIAAEIASKVKHIGKIISAEPEKGYCNIVIDWDDIATDVINEINKNGYFAIENALTDEAIIEIEKILQKQS